VWKDISTRLGGALVVLEPLAPGHEDDLFEAARDPKIWRWMPVNPSADRETFRSWLEAALEATEAGTEVAFATLDARTGEPVGSTRYLTLRPRDRGLEIGWTWLAPSRWRTGANVEAKLLMLEHAFERLGCIRVEFKTDARNERSREAISALPARFEGIFRKHMILPDGTTRDSAYYSITEDEWPEVRGNLQRRLDDGKEAR
jgi:RimJ/RimL family protein N-acetyltransferase